MQLGEGIAFGGVILSFLTFVLRESNKNEEKRGRIYGRVDEIKEKIKQEYVTKEVFGLLYNELKSDINEIKIDIKTIALDIKQIKR